MNAYQMKSGAGLAGLTRIDRPTREPAAGEIVVKIHAAALNFRDLMVADGSYLGADAPAVVPVADGAGEVIAVGRDVTRFRPGDRVINTYFPDWIDGPGAPAKVGRSAGAQYDGVLAEQYVGSENEFVKVPAHLDDVEAAALSCAGVTAWNALFVDGALRPGATVALLGTGGVSVWALQLAHAAGLRTIVTSSSDDKLARARALGADETVNYRATPEWQREVLRLTDGVGADLVLEVGGHDTLPRSIAAARLGGTVSVIGGVSGFEGPGLSLMSVIGGMTRLHGIMVGSRAMLDDLATFVAAQQIRPVIDRVFDFDDALAAYRHLESGQHFGKVVIRTGA